VEVGRKSGGTTKMARKTKIKRIPADREFEKLINGLKKKPLGRKKKTGWFSRIVIILSLLVILMAVILHLLRLWGYDIY
jgi:nitrogen fixation/metabolism regulation signal transduction histidine kinase